MDVRMLENPGTLAAGLHALLLGESDADWDDGDPGRPWFPDYEEVE